MADQVSPVEALSPASRAWGELEPHSDHPHWGMVVDTERCVGCWSCGVICKSENEIPIGNWWNRILTSGEALDTPHEQHGALEMHWVPLACQHCANAPCVKVCPVQATYHRSDGVVMQDYDRCIGCRYCMISCPYGVRVFNWGQSVQPIPIEFGMITARPTGTAEKCTFCVQRLAENQVPSCVWSCPAQARIFGDLNDPDSRINRLISEREGEILLEDVGTQPSVVYLPPRRRDDL